MTLKFANQVATVARQCTPSPIFTLGSRHKFEWSLARAQFISCCVNVEDEATNNVFLLLSFCLINCHGK